MTRTATQRQSRMDALKEERKAKADAAFKRQEAAYDLAKLCAGLNPATKDLHPGIGPGMLNTIIRLGKEAMGEPQ